MNGKDVKTPDVRKLSNPELWGLIQRTLFSALLTRKREDCWFFISFLHSVKCRSQESGESLKWISDEKIR